MISQTERVLVVPKSTLPNLPTVGFVRDDDFTSTFTEYFFIDRDSAETDVKLKQLIPYTIVRYDNKTLLYQRTEDGGEKRLSNKHSIGIGGHVNDLDENSHNRSLSNTIINACNREINEEIILNYTNLTYIGLINDESNDVGKVHLGLVFLCQAKNENVHLRDIEKHREAHFVDILTLQSSKDSLETWSEILLKEYLFKL